MKTLLIVVSAIAALSGILAAVIYATNGSWLLTTLWGFFAAIWIVNTVLVIRHGVPS